jgi:proline racemase
MRTQRAIQVVGCHAEGEQGDVIVGGVLPPPGATMYEKMRNMEAHFDDVRRLLICEPRGSVARHVNLLVPSTRSDCVAGAIIMEPTEYPPMSGSNTICVATVLLETGMVAMQEPVTRFKLDMPGGVVEIVADCKDGKCVAVTLQNVPAFVERLDARLEVEGLGEIVCDLAYGGMMYAIVDAERLGFSIVPEEARQLAEVAERIRLAARRQLPVSHPEFPDIRHVSIIQFARPFAGVGEVTRNTCIVAPGRSDRSPTGTGTCARMAVLEARGLMKVGDTMTHESIIGSRFHGRIVGLTKVGDRRAIVPTITGQAWITGTHTYFVDPTDPYPTGYVLSDTWGLSTITKQ